MAYTENDVPVSVRDIRAHMPREMRQRVLADYAPFLARPTNGGAWLQATVLHNGQVSFPDREGSDWKQA